MCDRRDGRAGKHAALGILTFPAMLPVVTVCADAGGAERSAGDNGQGGSQSRHERSTQHSNSNRSSREYDAT